MSSKTKKFLTVVAVTAVASIGFAAPSSAAQADKPAKKDSQGVVSLKIGDGWCC